MCGTSTTTATQTSSRSTWATCGARSTRRSVGRRSRRCAAAVTASARTAGDAVRTWWRRRSVRTRLTVAASAVMAIALVFTAVSLVWGLHRSLLGSVDGTAQERAREAARLPVTDGVLPSNAEADNVVQIVDATGQVVASTANVAGEPRLFAFAPDRANEVRSVRRVKVPDAADSYRVAVVAAGDGKLAYAAVPDDDAREAVRRLLVAVVLGFPFVVAVLSVITWVLVGRALRPAEAASRRQREFVADAAHEL